MTSADIFAQLPELNKYHWGDTVQWLIAFKQQADNAGLNLPIEQIREKYAPSRCTFCRRTLDIPADESAVASHPGGVVLACQHIICKTCHDFHAARAITQGVVHGDVTVNCTWAGEDGSEEPCDKTMFYKCHHENRPAVPPLNSSGDPLQWINQGRLAGPDEHIMDYCPRCWFQTRLDEWTRIQRENNPHLGKIWACCSGMRGLAKEESMDQPVVPTRDMTFDPDIYTMFVAKWKEMTFLDGDDGFEDEVTFVKAVE